MDRTKLDENSLIPMGDYDPINLTKEELIELFGQGYAYKDPTKCVRWVRETIKSDDINSLNCKQLSDHLKMWLEYQQFPGTSSNPLSQPGYNAFARWDQWFGAYVAGLGYIGEPSSSAYGAQLYSNGSWISPGSSLFPVTMQNFYKLVGEHKWSGGNVNSWGYVSPDTRVLGASSGITFVWGYGFNNTLVAIANLCRIINSNPVEIFYLKEQFAQFYDIYTDNYEIPAWAIGNFLSSLYYSAPAQTITEALSKHFGVLLRIVTRTEEVNGKVNKYGDDYVIVDYNPVLQELAYINSTGSVTALSMEKVAYSETIIWIYRKL